MDVRMVVQPLVPRVQHQLRGRLELPATAQRFIQGAPSGVEEQIVELATITENQAGQPIGQGEDHLEVGDLRQYQFRGLVQPIRAASTAALRAVAIGARIVDIALRVARRAFVGPPSQGRCTTEQDAR
jgi:hypothetical protein